MDANTRRPTIKDVARTAGVSPTTVSHAFNGKRAVRKETVAHILEVANRIGYRPHAIARGLRESRMKVIALMLRPLDSLESFLPEGVDFFMRFAGSAALTAMEHGYSLMLVSDPTKPGAPVSSLAADACIVTDPFENDPVLRLLTQQHIPVLSVGPDPALPTAYPSIDSDTEGETFLVLDHLEQAGATCIGLALGTDRNAWNIIAQETYTAWCAERNLDPLIYINPETDGEAAGAKIAAAAFDSKSSDVRRPDAIYCLTGRHAAGLVTAALERKISIPDDLLVVAGSDAAQNRTMRPTVTAIDLQPELVARVAIETTVRMLDGEELIFPVSGPDGVLHIRESTTRA